MDRIDEGVPGCVSVTFIILAQVFQNLVAIVIVIPALFLVVLPMMTAFVFIAVGVNLVTRPQNLYSEDLQHVLGAVPSTH